jgi:FkbM family methyltransferase
MAGMGPIERGDFADATGLSSPWPVRSWITRGEVKEIIKAILAQTPYRIVRDRGANRFQAIDVSLRNLKDRGFCPRVVIDGGAHLGSFSLLAKQFFGTATFHLVEPQPACSATLKALSAKEGFILHECALADHNGTISFSRTFEPNTGAHVQTGVSSETVTVPASTLDTLFAHRVTQRDRALLKLDLQGYELYALRGGPRLLPSIEIILTEVSFYAQAYEPPIVDLLSFLDASGFELYDIASLAGRSRDNRLHQGDFVFARKGSQLLEDTRWE